MVTIKKLTDWSDALTAARITANKEPSYSYPSDSFIKQIISAEHSPIRCVLYSIYWDKIESWVVTHLLRHHIGTLPFVGTQREDRTGVAHSERKRNELIPFMFIVNAQSIINISRRRLCSLASKETRSVWESVLFILKTLDPLLVEKCVPDCCYRGFCAEYKCCGYVQTEDYKILRSEYIKGGILPLEGV